MIFDLSGGGAGSSTDQVTLTLTRPAQSQRSTLRRTAAVVTRALRMDSGAMARFVAVGEDATDVILSTPLGCIVTERIHAVASTDGAVILADPLPGVLSGAAEDGSEEDAVLTFGGRVDMLWTGTPPPATGYTVIDTVPGADVRELFAGMEREADEHSGPAGLPPSLLDQPLLRLTSTKEAGIIEIAGRVVAALGALGLVVEPKREELRRYDMIRVSTTGSWIRIDALFGTAYVPRPGGLARIPSPN
ncbi:MAG: hypothetical protein ACTH1D_13345 [Mycobacteriaceae bacterium]|uniref:hypothetical protein n=1 Tax=Corynebacterium sp. TaxID=1720 RepID=UPI003F9AFE5E